MGNGITININLGGQASQGPVPNQYIGTPTYQQGAPQGNVTPDSASFSPLAQNGAQNNVTFQNGVPVVTNQDKQQAIIDYLQNHATVGTPQDAQNLVQALDQVPAGQLNLIFQNGTSFNFTNNDPNFQQNPNILGETYAENANGQRISPVIDLNEAYSNSPGTSSQAVQQNILHETTHAVDASLASELGLPTEFASQSDPALSQAEQNYKGLAAAGLVGPNGIITWADSAFDPSGLFPAMSNAQELLSDAATAIDGGGAATLAQQDPLTSSAATNLLSEASNVGNALVGV